LALHKFVTYLLT